MADQVFDKTGFPPTYLKDNMFAGRQDADQLAANIVTWLTDLSKDKGHDHHIYYDDCEKNGLVVKKLEDPKDKTLQDLVLTVHHCFMFTMSNTGCFKAIESHVGRRWLKMQVQQIIMQQPMIIPTPAPSLCSGRPNDGFLRRPFWRFLCALQPTVSWPVLSRL